jgi:midasin (ATPase involved in ribosome maturation)
VRVLTFHENMRKSDITERRQFGETGEEKTGWSMSDIMDGLELGDWIVLSEVNRANEDVWAEFNEILETKTKALNQRVIRGSRNSRFIATINPSKGEGRGIYEGKVMPGEFMNRFTNKVRVEYLPVEEEVEILKDYASTMDIKIIRSLVNVANEVRKDFNTPNGLVPFPVTTRSLIKIVRHLQVFPQDVQMLRTLFWNKAYWLDDKIHNPAARKLIDNLLDTYGLRDVGHRTIAPSSVVTESIGTIQEKYLVIGDVKVKLGSGGEYVPDTVIEEVQQNLWDLESS